jgi:hypothetical protein
LILKVTQDLYLKMARQNRLDYGLSGFSFSRFSSKGVLMLFPVTADTIGTLFNLLFIPFPAEIWKQAIRIVFENQLKHGIGRPPSNRSGSDGK